MNANRVSQLEGMKRELTNAEISYYTVVLGRDKKGEPNSVECTLDTRKVPTDTVDALRSRVQSLLEGMANGLPVNVQATGHSFRIPSAEV